MDPVSSNVIGNLVSKYIVDKFHMDHSNTFMIGTMISSMILAFKWDYIVDLHMYFIGVVCGCGYVYYYLSMKYREEYFSVILKDSIYICGITYLKYSHPEFFDSKHDSCSGVVTHDGNFYPQIGSKLCFHDKIHNVQGYIVSGYTEEPVGEKDMKKKEYYIQMFINKSCNMSAEEYLRKLFKYRQCKLDESKELCLYMFKILRKQNDIESICSEFYKGSRSDKKKRYNDYIKSYFSVNRDRLYTYLYNIHNHPEKFTQFGQPVHCNLLLHGPPGTGKSSFVRRMATVLERHIISVDITSFSDNIVQVYNTLQRPFCMGEFLDPHRYILLLEEFDITITHLHKKKLKNSVTFTESKDKIIIKPNTQREFQLEDLLEILQGPVPMHQSIIVATTNKYEEIRQICPALFRPGRLTPVKFDYLNWDTLQELSMFYFGKKLTMHPCKIEIPTSQITEIALDCSISNGGFNRFENELQNLLILRS